MKALALFLLALFLLLLGVPQAGASYKQGSFYQGRILAEKKKCTKKSAPMRKRCLLQVRRKASKTTLSAMKGRGLYGHRLAGKDIPARPGVLIWSKRLNRTPGASRTDFVLYSSRSFPGNKKIVVSGTLSLPRESKRPRLISWAHGTTGLGDSCAPSRGVDGSYGGAEPLIKHWLDQGYAVAATDYEGLGTPGIHPYLVGESEARGVVDIVPAVRSLSTISRQVYFAGHSQGAHAVLFASAPRKMTFDHKGTVAYAPPALLDVQAELISTQPEDAYGLSALASAILRGAIVFDNSIRPSDILSLDALQIYREVESKCLDDLGASFAAAEIGPGELLQDNWKSSPSGAAFMQALQAMHPNVSLSKKLLLLQGLDDTTVLPVFTNALYSELRASAGSLVQYLTYDNWSLVPTSTHQTANPSTHSSILADSLDQVDLFLRTP